MLLNVVLEFRVSCFRNAKNTSQKKRKEKIMETVGIKPSLVAAHESDDDMILIGNYSDLPATHI